MKGKCMKRIILASLVLSLLLGGLPALAEYTDPDDEDLLIEDIIEAPEEEKKEVLDTDGSSILTITCTGDLTIGGDSRKRKNIFEDELAAQGGDISFTMQNMRDLFLEDDLTLVNFEGTLTDSESVPAAKKNNVVLLVGHVERYNPAVEQMSKILSDTSKIRSLTSQRMSAASGRITDVDVAMDLMIHDVEVIQALVKSPVVKVHAASVNGGKDYISALLEFANGATANLTASRITQARVRTLTVTTDTNYIDMDFINQSINVHSQGRMPYVNQEEIPEWMNYGLKGSVEQLFIPTNQPLQVELAHFIDCVNGKAQPRVTGEDALDALRVVWQIQEKLGFASGAVSGEKLALAAE
jgi:hypothetical protein